MPIPFLRFHCHHCGKELDLVVINGEPMKVTQLRLYRRYGWTGDLEENHWYCKECRPANWDIDVMRHPRYYNYRDQWDGTDLTHEFEDEPYDHYADRELQDRLMCRICDHSKWGNEDDGSSWLMCMADDVGRPYGHNLYDGHFYGSAIRGRICPYFSCGKFWKGRDPEQDKKDGKFHVPYCECYDGD